MRHIFIFFLPLLLFELSSATSKFVCYYGSWAVYRPGEGKFDVEQIAPITSVCTHIIFGFAGLNSQNHEIIALDPWNELEENYGRGAYKRFNALRKLNPELKTILAIGGWNEGSVKYSAMASNPASRRIFVTSVIQFLKAHDFNGLDMDWEYPANRGGVPSDKQNFVLLLKELREEFDKHGFLLTSAVSAGKSTIDSAYDIPEISKYLHFINVMTYDYHGAWEKFTGHNSPLYANPSESLEHHLLNINYSINYWIEQGAPREKLILGLGLYGRTFLLANPQLNKPGDPVLGPGASGPYTREPGTLGYNEICKNQHLWTVVQESYYRAPYAHYTNQWVGYDDVWSVQVKTEFAKCLGLDGVMVWSVETDDFHGGCLGQPFPLLNSIKESLIGSVHQCPVLPGTPLPPPPSPPPPPSTPTTNSNPPVSTNTPSVTPHPLCEKEGYHRDPHDCSKFYYCAIHNGEYIVNHYQCSDGLVFDLKLLVCNWLDKVPECKN